MTFSAVRTVVRQTYFATALTTVFTTARAFTVKKDVLPTQLISHVIYHFECRHCDSRYVGRTLQHLNARVKQHVPLYLLSDAAKAQRPGRGRPRKQVPVAQQNHTITAAGEPTASAQLRETVGNGQAQVRRPVTRSMTRTLVMASTTGHGLAVSSSVGLSSGAEDGMEEEEDEEGVSSDEESELDNQDEDDRTEGESTTKGSAIKKHLLSSSQCRSVYDDSCFTVLCRARRFRELKVLEAVFIRKHNPNLCIQKENVTKLRLFT